MSPTESPRPSLAGGVVRNTALIVSVQIAIRVLSFIFGVYVVRRLGDTHFGRYSTALAYVAIFAMLTDLGTSSLSLREMARRREAGASLVPDLIALRIALSVATMGGITLSAWWLGKPPELVLAIFVASGALLLYAVHGPLDTLLLAQEQFAISSALGLLNQMVFIGLGTLALLIGMGYLSLLVASLAGVASAGMASLYVVLHVMRLRLAYPNPGRWWGLLRSSFPFGVIGALDEFSRRFDTVFMSFVLTDAAVGWYNVSYNLTMMALLLAQSFGLSLFPSLVRAYDSGRGSIRGPVRSALRYLLLFSFPIAVGATLLGDRIILLLYGQAFGPTINVFRIMVWALPSMFLSELLGRTMSTLHLERPAARMTVIGSTTSVVLGAVFILRWGLTGAAVAMVASRLLTVVLSSLVIGPALVWGDSLRSVLRVAGATTVMGVVVWLLRDGSQLLGLGQWAAVVTPIVGGAIAYGAAALRLGALSASEARSAYDGIRYGLVQTVRTR